MQNRYPLWKNILLILLVIIGFIYALPNIYSDDPAVQISAASRNVEVDQKIQQNVMAVLKQTNNLPRSVEFQQDSLLLRFSNPDTQLVARDVIKAALGNNYTVALNLASSSPRWLAALGATPMKQGLDLRGGVYFLLEVDVDSVLTRRVDGFLKTIQQELREIKIRYTNIHIDKNDKSIYVQFRSKEDLDNAFGDIKQKLANLEIQKQIIANNYRLVAKLPAAELNEIRQSTIEQTMSILRNRVNELGVAEAIVQQQGATRIAVDLPGIQDSARAKQILGGTATLEFHMVDQDHDAQIAQQTGGIPIDDKLYSMDGRPILLKRQVVLSGDSITSAISSFDQQTASPAVSIQLGGGGESLFSRVTRENIGKRMAIVFVETVNDSQLVAGKVMRTSRKTERVISAPVVQSALGNNFQITGLQDVKEARDLSLQLRAGALPAAIYPVEERTVGPTLGKENIHRGIVSLVVAMGIILFVMLGYYRVFGLIADIALVLNLILLIAALSIIGNTLTLPGIAGIVLTVGMAVDANVLIYERIREELRHGITPQVAIYAGYERAFSTIVDANVSTLIVAIILFAIGTGPIKGFAVTLMIGLLTSMLTGIAITRAITNWIYGGRHVKKLSIGIDPAASVRAGGNGINPSVHTK